jgi:hypothetical protein
VLRATAARRTRLLLIGTGVALVIAGCGGGGSSSPSPKILAGASTSSPAAGPTATTIHAAQAAAATPSKAAEMICSTEAQQEIVADATGARTTEPVVPTWADQVYSCRYVYGADVVVLSVKELADKTQTDGYFNSLSQQLGRSRSLNGLGQGGFATPDGSVVVRKDFKVLLVDVSRLPEQFGTPLTARGNIAVNIASVIMGCWTGD